MQLEMNSTFEQNEARQACLLFARIINPYLNLENNDQYEQALQLIESLLEEAEDNKDEPLNPIIELLSESIRKYEARDPRFEDFDRAVKECTGVDIVRLLMDQHGLGMKDLPEIGSKSMVSRVLSGQRELSKKHILALSERFGVEPGLFL